MRSDNILDLNVFKVCITDQRFNEFVTKKLSREDGARCKERGFVPIKIGVSENDFCVELIITSKLKDGEI